MPRGEVTERVPPKNAESLATLKEKLDNIRNRMESLRDRLDVTYELIPVSDMDKANGTQEANVLSLNYVAKEIQSYLLQCEDVLTKIRG